MSATILENTGVVALRALYLKYSNVLSSLTFFLNLFHFAFCYKLIVCTETTYIMKLIGEPLTFIYRYKALLFYIGKLYAAQYVQQLLCCTGSF